MESVIDKLNNAQKKKHVVDVKSGDTVRVHQKIREGNKERIQVFEGLVIRTDRKNSHTASITVRRIASGIGVEKSYLIHSPLITKIEVVKRSKVRRNYLSYMRARTGKSARLSSVGFDREEVNAIPEDEKEVASAEEPTEDSKSKDQADEKPAETEKAAEAKEEKQTDNKEETKAQEESKGSEDKKA